MEVINVQRSLLEALRVTLAEYYPDKRYILMRAWLVKEEVEILLFWFSEVNPDFFEKQPYIPPPVSEKAKQPIREAIKALGCPVERLGVTIAHCSDNPTFMISLVNVDSFLKEDLIFVF